MDIKIIYKFVLILLLTAGIYRVSESPASSETKPPNDKMPDAVDTVLKQLNTKAQELQSYEAKIEYKFTQPLLESESLRKGALYYTKLDGKSKLRIHFQTAKQEDEKEQKYIEEYIVLDGGFLTHPGHKFEGTWIVHIDYQIETVKYYQLAEPGDPNETVDVFDLASRNLPMIGFSKIEDLKKQFEITLVEPKKNQPEDFIQVHLKVKPNSVYEDDYVHIDFWIDKKLGLPVKIVAVSTEPESPYGDVSEIKFLKPKVNKQIDKNLFNLKIPEDFGEPEIIPLKAKNERK
jgi:outer membrane lipoprotein-sorting protein